MSGHEGAAIKGEYLDAHHFFGKQGRGTVAHYRRPRPERDALECVRVEIQSLGGAEGEARRKITMELSSIEAARLLAVLMGDSAAVSIRRVRSGAPPKLFELRYQPGGASGALMSQGGAANVLTLKAAFADQDALGMIRVVLNALAATGVSGAAMTSWLQCCRELGARLNAEALEVKL